MIDPNKQSAKKTELCGFLTTREGRQAGSRQQAGMVWRNTDSTKKIFRYKQGHVVL